jgi:hypothetical protein
MPVSSSTFPVFFFPLSLGPQLVYFYRTEVSRKLNGNESAMLQRRLALEEE